MTKPNVFLVHLRRPGRDDLRSDPFYEFGSFGCTTCHCKNLLHPNHAEELIGAQLAFVQGGKLGSRLVFITPPITEVTKWKKYCNGKWIRFCEVKWATTKPAAMPFKYTEAPILAWNKQSTEFSKVTKFLANVRRTTVEARLCSKIRSRAKPLVSKLADQVIRVYDEKREKAAKKSIASTYDQALPRPVPEPDRTCKARKAKYHLFHERLRDDSDIVEGVQRNDLVTPETRVQSRCGDSRRRKSCR